jgi:phosphoribosylglycinamide formyltransferase-1
MTHARTAIFASGSGSNAENIITFFKNHPQIVVTLVLSNNPDAPVLQRAARLGVTGLVLNKRQFRETGEVVNWLQEEKITHIVLAGFLWLVPENLIEAYPNRIINIHPALLPQYGGKGMYGLRVHEAVVRNKDLESGITIHLVNQRYDEGQIIFQEYCKVEETDSPETLAARVQVLEHKFYPLVIENWIMKSQASTA